MSRVDQQYSREHVWTEQSIPTEEAVDWNCKYVVRANRDLVDGLADDQKGYIMIQVEQYAFDQDVFLIVQEHAKFKDFKYSVPDPKTKIYGVKFS